MGSDLRKLDSFTFETSKNHLIRNFLRYGRLRVKLFYDLKEKSTYAKVLKTSKKTKNCFSVPQGLDKKLKMPSFDASQFIRFLYMTQKIDVYRF